MADGKFFFLPLGIDLCHSCVFESLAGFLDLPVSLGGGVQQQALAEAYVSKPSLLILSDFAANTQQVNHVPETRTSLSLRAPEHISQ